MRFIVETGEKVSKFFAEDMQNIYYKYLFLNEMKEKLKKHKFTIDKDYEYKSKKYWSKYCKINTMWHSFYSYCNGIKDVRYIPENIYYSKIEPFYNKKSFAKAIDDKCFYSERFKGIKLPNIILRNISGNYFDDKFNILSIEDAVDLCYKCDEFVIKSSIDGAGGDSVKFICPSELNNREELTEIFHQYEKNFVIQDVIKQHGILSSINTSSINTIRFITFLYNGEVHLLSSVLRMGGVGARVDNFSSGGISCGICEDGTLKKVAYDEQYNKYTKHPSGAEFAEIKIPYYGKAVNAVKKQHVRFGHFRIISWDIAIDPNGDIILIEFNITPQSIDLHQINNGPLFGDLTDEVLKDVFSNIK
ncbi:sugar-transfer associated ATP-grasp domain-containing protein [Haloimpatiens sp. FM7330]|uniref:sugar-transfer associated ATP-grasp domain-containing protein n=1 Tax=Haloimpatiens sp. FM7330 TaxID=3298610 RepID=UPI003645DEB8